MPIKDASSLNKSQLAETIVSDTVTMTRKYLTGGELLQMIKNIDEYKIIDEDESCAGDNIEEQIEIETYFESSIVGFTDRMTAVPHILRKIKAVILLSTLFKDTATTNDNEKKI